jgi:lipopolysaccharide/colanic/teichoic acid biosynthesis glycosyltransferase
MGVSVLKQPRRDSLAVESRLFPSYNQTAPSEGLGSTLAPEPMFRKILSFERRRSDRSGRRFVLMLVHAHNGLSTKDGDATLAGISTALSLTTRETDLQGWYKQGWAIGTIYTEIGSGNIAAILDTLHTKVISALRTNLNPDKMNAIHLSFHVFPDQRHIEEGGGPADGRLYPDLKAKGRVQRLSGMVKRAIDIVGSASALLLLSPVLFVIAVAIKLTSHGPILFRQQRVGKYGSRFTFLKFRSMYFKNDAKIHQDFVRKLILANKDQKQGDDEKGVYKIKDDPRITPIGRLIRKTSLDELPQFFNVLVGEMSLVGPRPPIPYEVEAYDTWHRRRYLESKPGITGLWQVEGRSRIRFDDMVRLDLKYAKTCSPWLDLKILLRTPGAVLRGDGAY